MAIFPLIFLKILYKAITEKSLNVFVPCMKLGDPYLFIARFQKKWTEIF
jgi:hypothetical protein